MTMDAPLAALLRTGGKPGVWAVISVFPELPGWRFVTSEVEPGLYEVFGADGAGRRVASRGRDPNVVMSQCRQAAACICSPEPGSGRGAPAGRAASSGLPGTDPSRD